MKVTIEVDCTPHEAREFFGLPDVKPLQAAMMDKFQARMEESIDSFSPEALLHSWMTFDPKLAQRFQEMFLGFTGLGSKPTAKDKE
ncbi:MAG TPA: DUF6489 family protein [Xanthobacteraceae bacterium]|nr:DUF6489 family protein [Xanthobacteraceae bacterium]